MDLGEAREEAHPSNREHRCLRHLVAVAEAFLQPTGRIDRQQMSILQDRYALAYPIDLGDAVRGEQNRAILRIQPLDRAVDDRTRHRVEIAGRLVHKDDLRLAEAGDSNAQLAAIATAQVFGQHIAVRLEMVLFERFDHELVD
uniref:Uncharacterized protein n=1 Tax=Anopheles atroparvus TaxID=41427 RepID=A0A182JCZ2_ANOAO